MASANGADTLQNAELRSAAARVHAAGASRGRRLVARVPEPAGAAVASPRIVNASGTISSRMSGGARQHGGREAAAPARNTSAGTIDDAAEAGAVEGQADGEPALGVEPQAQDVVDGADAHGGPAEGHHQVGGEQLPGRGDERQRRRRDGERRRADEDAGARAEAADGVVDEDHQQRADEVVGRGGAARSARPASRAGAAARRDRSRARRSRSPSTASPSRSRRPPPASPDSAARPRRAAVVGRAAAGTARRRPGSSCLEDDRGRHGAGRGRELAQGGAICKGSGMKAGRAGGTRPMHDRMAKPQSRECSAHVHGSPVRHSRAPRNCATSGRPHRTSGPRTCQRTSRKASRSRTRWWRH